MLRAISRLMVAAVMALACSAPSSRPASSPALMTPPAPTHSGFQGATSLPETCAGIEIELLRVHIAATASTGEVLNTDTGNSVVRTVALAWPDGYSIQPHGSSYAIVNSSGSVIVIDGSRLAHVQACTGQNLLTVAEPIPSPL